jgi:Cu2+-exporting ATPase
MSDAAPSCALCGLPTTGIDVTDDAGTAYCCRGCRNVDAVLGDVEGVDADDVAERRAADEGTAADDATEGAGGVPDGHESTFLEVRGMYCATCEAFLESVAAETDGVSDASASYVTETVRVDHDPDETTVEELADAVSGLGYSAFPKDDAFRHRQADHLETVRVAVGVLVGMMVMLQYVTIIYPTYFGGLWYDDRTAAFLADAMASTSGIYFFVIIAVLSTIVLLVTGWPILRGAYVAVRTRTPNMDLLVAIAALSAYAYSLLAVLVVPQPHVYFDVTVAIIVIVTVGSYYESSIKRRATGRLSELTAIRVDEACRVTTDGDHEDVAVDALAGGDRVLVRAGERVPVDGEVSDGEAAVDESVVTGESVPVTKREGDRVVGGSTVTDGALTVAVAPDAASSLDRIAELVWDLQSSDHGIQGLAHRLATVFVPVVLALAVLAAAGYLLVGASPTAALLVGLTVLIVSCPCALGLATPLAVAAGIRDGLRNGIVVFDETVFERVREADTVVFDKTGTLTTGEMTVVEADAPTDLQAAAAALERRSAHPVGRAVAALTDGSGAADDGADPLADGGAVGDRTATDDGGADAPLEPREDNAGPGPTVEGFESHHRGVGGIVDGEAVLVGHPRLFDAKGWPVPDRVAAAAEAAQDRGHIPVVVGRDGAAEGLLAVGDRVREDWRETFDDLADRDVDVVVLTGDHERAAARFADHDAVTDVFAGVPPEGKAAAVGGLADEGETVMVGDGTNDAPALARADLGIALGSGTAIAADAADAAIVDDDLRSVETMFDLSTAAGRRVTQNIGWAFCYNGVAIPVAVAGLLNPLFAAVAMGASSLLVVGNSSRTLVDETGRGR